MSQFITPTINGVIGGIFGLLMGRTVPWLFDGLMIGLLFGGFVELIFSRLPRRRWLLMGAFEAMVFVFVAIPVVSIQPFLEPQPSAICCESPADYGLYYEDVVFRGGDDLKLSGWYLPSQNGATVILLHGNGGTRLSMLPHAEALATAGYGVLMYDQRGLGQSEGETRSWGWLDEPDVHAAVDFLLVQPEVDPERIGIVGASLGGQIAIRAAARDERISAVVADGASMLRYEDMPRPRNILEVAEYGFMWLVDRGFEARLGVPAPQGVKDVIGWIAPRPILLITGLQDRQEADRIRGYYQAAGSNAQLWEIPEVTHTEGPYLRPEEYAARLVGFFDAAFDPVQLTVVDS